MASAPPVMAAILTITPINIPISNILMPSGSFIRLTGVELEWMELLSDVVQAMVCRDDEGLSNTVLVSAIEVVGLCFENVV